MARREHKEKMPTTIASRWNLFTWRTCSSCKEDFVREGFWEHYFYQYRTKPTGRVNCKACFPDWKDAIAYDTAVQTLKEEDARERLLQPDIPHLKTPVRIAATAPTAPPYRNPNQ